MMARSNFTADSSRMPPGRLCGLQLNLAVARQQDAARASSLRVTRATAIEALESQERVRDGTSQALPCYVVAVDIQGTLQLAATLAASSLS